jgi:universal stress protein A
MAPSKSTILVATDGSATAAAAVACATELARDLGAGLLVVSVWHELRGDFGIPSNPFVPGLVEIERDWTTMVATEAAEEVRAAGVDAEPIVRRGQPAAVVREIARERNARLIVVGSHGWGKVEGLLFGSVSAAVLRDAPCPVLVVPKPHAVESVPVRAGEAAVGGI